MTDMKTRTTAILERLDEAAKVAFPSEDMGLLWNPDDCAEAIAIIKHFHGSMQNIADLPAHRQGNRQDPFLRAKRIALSALGASNEAVMRFADVPRDDGEHELVRDNESGGMGTGCARCGTTNKVLLAMPCPGPRANDHRGWLIALAVVLLSEARAHTPPELTSRIDAALMTGDDIGREWKMMPFQPTDHMTFAGQDFDTPASVWKAMWTAFRTPAPMTDNETASIPRGIL